MFGIDNIKSDYTFTQSEDRLFKIQSSKAISSYLENFGVSKKDKSEKLNNDFEESSKSIDNKENNTNEKIEKTHIEIDGLFGDEESGDGDFFYDGKVSSITKSFESLAAAVGSSNDKVTKNQLIALLQSLSSENSQDADKVSEIAFVKSLIAKFDILSDGTNYITSFNGVKDAQDYETVTKEQVTLPIDIRI